MGSVVFTEAARSGGEAVGYPAGPRCSQERGAVRGSGVPAAGRDVSAVPGHLQWHGVPKIRQLGSETPEWRCFGIGVVV